MASASLTIPADARRRRMHLKARCRIGRRVFQTKAVETSNGEAIWR